MLTSRDYISHISTTTLVAELDHGTRDQTVRPIRELFSKSIGQKYIFAKIQRRSQLYPATPLNHYRKISLLHLSRSRNRGRECYAGIASVVIDRSANAESREFHATSSASSVDETRGGSRSTVLAPDHRATEERTTTGPMVECSERQVLLKPNKYKVTR